MKFVWRLQTTHKGLAMSPINSVRTNWYVGLMCNVSELMGRDECLWVFKRMLLYQSCLKIGRPKHCVPSRLKYI